MCVLQIAIKCANALFCHDYCICNHIEISGDQPRERGWIYAIPGGIMSGLPCPELKQKSPGVITTGLSLSMFL